MEPRGAIAAGASVALLGAVLVLLLRAGARDPEPRHLPAPAPLGSVPAGPATLGPATERDVEALAAGDGRFPEGYVPERFRTAGATEATLALGGATVLSGDALDGGPAALVAAVEPGSWAERAGLRAGDRIVRIDGEGVTPARLAAASSAAESGGGVRLRVERGAEAIDLPAPGR